MKPGQSYGQLKAEPYEFHHERDDKYQPAYHHVSVAHPKHGTVAQFSFVEDGQHMVPTDVGVDKAHRRKGIATEAYRQVEQKTGKKIRPNSDQTKDAKTFWSQPNRPFGLKKGQSYLDLRKAEDDEFDGRSATREEVEQHIDRTCPHVTNNSRNARLHAGTHYDKWTKMKVPLSDIGERPPHSKRDVAKYTKMIREGHEPPAVVLGSMGKHEGMNGGRHIIHSVQDGAHRIAAARAAGKTHINAYVGEHNLEKKK